MNALVEALERIQEEQRPWIAHNFGDRPSHQPLLGIVEEIGELAEAFDEHETNDAIADALIFICDYCSAIGWSASVIAGSVEPIGNASHEPSYVLVRRALVHVGRLAHAHLKIEQGIRAHEDHATSAADAIAQMIIILATFNGLEKTAEIVLATWEKVRKRDWKANPKRAHEGS